MRSAISAAAVGVVLLLLSNLFEDRGAAGQLEIAAGFLGVLSIVYLVDAWWMKRRT